jgi:hypothetical protein
MSSGEDRTPVGDNRKENVIGDASDGTISSTASALGCLGNIIDVGIFERLLPHYLVFHRIEVFNFNRDENATLTFQIACLNRDNLILYTSKHGRDPGITVVFNYLNGVVASESSHERFRTELAKRGISKSTTIDNRANRNRSDVIRNTSPAERVARCQRTCDEHQSTMRN